MNLIKLNKLVIDRSKLVAIERSGPSCIKLHCSDGGVISVYGEKKDWDALVIQFSGAGVYGPAISKAETAVLALERETLRAELLRAYARIADLERLATQTNFFHETCNALHVTPVTPVTAKSVTPGVTPSSAARVRKHRQRKRAAALAAGNQKPLPGVTCNALQVLHPKKNTLSRENINNKNNNLNNKTERVTDAPVTPVTQTRPDLTCQQKLNLNTKRKPRAQTMALDWQPNAALWQTLLETYPSLDLPAVLRKYRKFRANQNQRKLDWHDDFAQWVARERPEPAKFAAGPVLARKDRLMQARYLRHLFTGQVFDLQTDWQADPKAYCGLPGIKRRDGTGPPVPLTELAELTDPLPLAETG